MKPADPFGLADRLLELLDDRMLDAKGLVPQEERV